jgi:NAD(P)-dependent dehydrogenase (short-subunit alcohol dehydrogenase family)
MGDDMRRFDGKAAIVTGGANGIGRAIALGFAAEGASVAIWDADLEAGAAVAAQVQEAGGRAVMIQADVGVRADVQAAFARTVAAMPEVQVLVNNAAVMIRGNFLDLLEEDWDTIFRTNLKSAFLCSQAIARRWIAQRVAGRIINVSSVDAALSHTLFPHYCAAKAGLRSLTKTTALALAPFGIRVNEVAPGFTVPGMASRITSAPWWPERARSFVPLGRAGRAEEVAAAALFLASDAAAYVTGTELVVDGAHSIGAHDWILRQATQSSGQPVGPVV